MFNQFCKKRFSRMILLIFVLSCFSSYTAHNPNIVFGYGSTPSAAASAIILDDMPLLTGVFAPLIAMSSSPFIALTIMSGMGTFLNLGMIDSTNIPLADIIMQLPISRLEVFIALFAITAIKYLLSLISVSKIFCDATLGQIENYTGTAIAAAGAFILTSTTSVYAASAYTSDNGFFAILLTNIIAFLVSALAYVVYVVMKTMIRAIDILAFLVSPIPGATFLFTNIKYILVGIFAWNALSNPFVTSILGILILFAAFLVFKAAKRIELYYRHIYLKPLISSLFGKGYFVSILPNKIPRIITKEFDNISVCLKGFFMNKTTSFYKRELCYFVRANGTNYLFKKRLFGKKIKIEVMDDIYIEKCTVISKRFTLYIRIFTDKGMHINSRKIHLVLRREYSQIIDKLTAEANLINCNIYIPSIGEFNTNRFPDALQK